MVISFLKALANTRNHFLPAITFYQEIANFRGFGKNSPSFLTNFLGLVITMNFV